VCVYGRRVRAGLRRNPPGRASQGLIERVLPGFRQRLDRGSFGLAAICVLVCLIPFGCGTARASSKDLVPKKYGRTVSSTSVVLNTTFSEVREAMSIAFPQCSRADTTSLTGYITSAWAMAVGDSVDSALTVVGIRGALIEFCDPFGSPGNKSGGNETHSLLDIEVRCEAGGGTRLSALRGRLSSLRQCDEGFYFVGCDGGRSTRIWYASEATNGFKETSRAVTSVYMRGFLDQLTTALRTKRRL
jgi:hypothetical protein